MLKQLIDHYEKGNKTNFAKRLGISPQGISTWLSRGTIDAELIYAKCESLNADWLLSGEGSMLLSNQSSEVNKLDNAATSSTVEESIKKFSTTVHDRIKLVVKWLIGAGVAKNQEAIGGLMGYSNKSSFSQILNNKVSLPNDFIDRLCSLNESINFVWVKDGVGNMTTDISASNSPSRESILVPDMSSSRFDTVALRLLDKLDEKDNVISEKEAKIEELSKENSRLEERVRLLESQHKIAEHQTKEIEATEAFIKESSRDYGDGSSIMRKHVTSETSLEERI